MSKKSRRRPVGRRSAPPPERGLFHYTDSAGLAGILKSRSLFATHYSFLNDSSEGAILHNQLRRHLEAELRRVTPKLVAAGILRPDAREILEADYYASEVEGMIRAMASATDTVAPFYICSFCIHERRSDQYLDGLLSQWRGYGRGGFAIEFDEKEIREFAEAERCKWQYQGILTNEVRYRNYEKFVDLAALGGLAGAMVKTIVGQIVPKARDKLEEILGPKEVNDFAEAYLRHAPFLKHPGFEEENEFRIAALSNRMGLTDDGDTREHKRVNFRALGDGRVTPFIILGETEDVKLPIRSVLVGPNPHQASQVAALEIMLSELEIKAEVRTSRIPFRG